MRSVLSGILLAATLCGASSASAQRPTPSWQVIRWKDGTVLAQSPGAGPALSATIVCSPRKGHVRIIFILPNQPRDEAVIRLFGGGGARGIGMVLERLPGNGFAYETDNTKLVDLLTGPDQALLMQLDGQNFSGYLTLNGAAQAVRAAIAKCPPQIARSPTESIVAPPAAGLAERLKRCEAGDRSAC